ncbi:MAG: DUF72 domain-containing protein [Armatimonadota bacterium]
MRRGEARIGTSGWQYQHWKGLFYPEGLPVSRWFAFYAERYDTVEINNSFYRLPEAATFEAWRRQAPPGFLYAVKYSRYATHMKKLKDPGESLSLFLERAERLESCLGPILVQLPPRWKANPARLEAFLEAAPKRHRWTIEVRDPSWLREDVMALLHRHEAALCVHDLLPDHPWRVTAPWVYVRFHGTNYGGTYPPERLREWADRLRGCLDDGLDVYAYFNNDWHGYALPNATDLRRCLLE